MPVAVRYAVVPTAKVVVEAGAMAMLLSEAAVTVIVAAFEEVMLPNAAVTVAVPTAALP